MRIKTRPLYILILINLAVLQSCRHEMATDPVSFNDGWKFHKGAAAEHQKMILTILIGER